MTIPACARWKALAGDARLWLVVLLACILINFIRYCPYNYEVESTTHYYSDSHFYGGYTWTCLETKDGYQDSQGEALHLCRNFSTLLNRGTDPDRPLIFQFSYDGAGRLLAGSFLPSLLTRMTLGLLSFSHVFLATNLFLWGLSIWCTYRLGQVYFANRPAPVIAATFMACYPVFPLMLHSVKIQYAGIPYMLFGLYAYETRLKDAACLRQFLFFLAYGFLGMISALGTIYLMIALLGIVLPRAWKEGRRSLAAAFAGLVGGALATNQVFCLMHIDPGNPFEGFHISDMIHQSLAYLWTMLRGGDITRMRFLNCPGSDFFSSFLPGQTTGILQQNLVICMLAGVGILAIPAARKFGLTALLLFLPATAPVLITGYYHYHYAYCTAPVMIMLFLACAGLVGNLMTRDFLRFRLAGVILFVLALMWFNWDQKRALSNYFGNEGAYKSIPAFVFHGNDCDEY